MLQPIIKSTLLVGIIAASLILLSRVKAVETKAFITQVIKNGSSTNTFTWHIEDKAYHGQADTNGLACKVYFSGFALSPSQQPPVCVVLVTNETTNTSHNYWRSFPTNYLKIELLDSSRNPTKKTPEGEKYEASITEGELVKIFYSKRNWRSGIVKIHPTETQFASFSIPELFEVKEAGEYTLHVQMRLIQVWPEFKITWLPEATAEIQIQTNDKPK
jgi:hypothetical protein